MMRIASIVLLLALFFPACFFGQGETSNWYFGNGAGITFNGDGSVTPVINGKLDTFEGCATISDNFGDLLFYTDGIVVYNRNHEVMQNGTDLYGDPSSTQSALIVPGPGDPNIFYIFTVDTAAFENDPDRGLNYSTVDISMNNGKGAITEKNIPLLSDCSEKIAAVVKDCSNQSIWLLTFASEKGTSKTFNTFHAFEVNTTGVVAQSVKTTFSTLNIKDPRGYLKLSPDGSKLANANMADGLFVYDFEATSGKLKNQKKIIISGTAKASYGVEFSPSSQYLYVHTSNDAFAETGHRSSLLQYDMRSSDISKSQEIINTASIYRGALQLGDNGKIYRTTPRNYFRGSPFLSVLNNPDEQGDAVNYEHEVIALNGRNATQGLPPFIQSFFNKIALIKNPDGTKSTTISVCARESVTLEGDLKPGATYLWEKDGQPMANATNKLQIPRTRNIDSGRYRLTIITDDPNDCPIIGEAQIKVIPLPETSELVLEQCDTDENISDGFTVIDLKQVANGEALDFVFYETIENRNNDIPIRNPETYTNTQAFSQTLFYTATNILGCSDAGEITLIINPETVQVSSASPIMVCADTTESPAPSGTIDFDALRQEQFAGLEVAFYSNLTDARLEDNALDGNFTTSDTTIHVRTENNNQCQSIETVKLIVNPSPKIALENSYQVCSDGTPLVVDAPSGYDSYAWYKIDKGQEKEIGRAQQVSITSGGNYRLQTAIIHENEGQSIQCSSSIDFEVNQSNRATFKEMNIKDFSNNNTITTLVSGDGDYEFSLDGQIYQDEPLFKNVQPGFYTVFVRDKKGCGVAEREVTVVGYPKFFTPNGDGFNDTWQLIGSGKNAASGNIAIYDRFGRLLKQLSAEGQGWDGNFLGQQLPASDYWFRITLVDGREFKGHFALKR